jgi:hypothetical protein
MARLCQGIEIAGTSPAMTTVPRMRQAGRRPLAPLAPFMQGLSVAGPGGRMVINRHD